MTDEEGPLDRRVMTLVHAARAFAITALDPIEREFHLAIGSADQLRRWDYLLTVAGVAVAVSCLHNQVSASHFARLLPRIRQQLDGWDTESPAALDDCRAFITRSLQGNGLPDSPQHVSIVDASGIWVLWNLFGRCPSYEESRPARAIGRMLQATFAGWWA